MSEAHASNRAVTLDEVLANKEARVRRQRAIMQSHPGGIVSVTVNIPGPVKDSEDARTVLGAAIKAVLTASLRGGWLVNFRQILRQDTGPEALLSTNLDPASLKKTMLAIEETHPLGRLFDLDVLDEDGKPIPRSVFGAPERACLICRKAAQECGRSRAHDLGELTRSIAAMVARYREETNTAPGGEDSLPAPDRTPPVAEPPKKFQALRRAMNSASAALPSGAPNRKRGCLSGCLGLLIGCLTRLLLFCVILYLILAAGLAFLGREIGKGLPYSHAVVVMGGEISAGGTPSPGLAARLDKAVELYRKERRTVIVSGGKSKSGADEVTAMTGHLIRQGVASEDLVIDNSGVDTWATARFTGNYLRAKKQTRLVVVSRYFHLPRCFVAFRFAGVESVSLAAPNDAGWRDVYSVAREVPTLFFYLRDHATMEKLADLLLL